MSIREFLKRKEIAWRFLMFDDKGEEYNRFGKIILADLRNFCYGTKSTFSANELEMARNTGRKEVFERIMTFLNVETSKLYELDEEIIDND